MNRRRDRGPQPRGSGGARTDEISGPAGRPRPPTPSTKQARCVPGRSVRFSIALGEILDQGNDGSTQSGTVDPHEALAKTNPADVAMNAFYVARFQSASTLPGTPSKKKGIGT
jgi:hypothetical protein